MTPKKSLEDILAEYTEDLMAEREPRLAEDIAALDEDERSQLTGMLALVRRLKAAHREAPPPREEFVQHLDAFVREEVARHIPPAPESAGSRKKSRPAAESRSILECILGGRGLNEALTLPGSGTRWRLVAAAALFVVLGLQIQLYLHVRRLDQRNQALVARLEQFGLSGGLVPLALPRDQQTTREKGPGTPGAPSLDDLFAGIELRVRLEQRVRELEKVAGTKTGRDRQETEAILMELRALLRPSPKP